MTAQQWLQLASTLVTLVTAFIWPAALVACLLIFRRPLGNFLDNLSELNLKAAGVEASAKRGQVAAAAVAAAEASRDRETGAENGGAQPDVDDIVDVLPGRRALRKIDGPRVLWVDDHPQNNRYERQALEALGIRIDLSTSTDSALEMAAEAPYRAADGTAEAGVGDEARITGTQAQRGPRMEGVIFTDLTEAEQLLWDAFPRGARVDLGRVDAPAESLGQAIGSDRSRVVRAEVIGALLLGAVETEAGWAAALRLRGAVVTGRLDLMGAAIAWPLICERCYFEDAIGFVDCSVKTVSLVGCQLPAFNGTRMSLAGLLDLGGSVIGEIVRLEQAKVTGQLCLRDAKVGTAPGTLAVSASGLTVDGDLDASGLRAHGAVSMPSAGITGSVDLSAARITFPAQEALVMDHCVIGGRLSCRQAVVEGEFRIYNSRVAAMIFMRGARLDNPGKTAFSAGGLTADGGLFLTGGFTAKGELRLVGAQLAANLTLNKGMFDNPGGLAVNLDGATIGSCYGTGLTCKGQLSLNGARISGDLDLTGAALEAGNGEPTLLGQRAQIDGKLVLSAIKAQGEVDLRTVKVGASLLLNGAELANPAGSACRLSSAQVAADVLCYGMTADGSVRLTGITVGGAIVLRQVRLSHPHGIALDAAALQARDLALLPAVPVDGAVNLSNASVGVLRDDPGSWPAALTLDGFTYQTLEPQLPARQRLQWLARDPRGHQSRPYEQLAAYYNAFGQQAQARAVLYARERIQRQGKAPFYRAWSLLQDITVGYGYRPRRALVWLALLLTAGSIVFSVAPPPALQPDMTPHFNGVIYTVDLMLPVVNLGQKYAFNPGGAEQWLSYLLSAAGWILATTVAAGAARILRRG